MKIPRSYKIAAAITALPVTMSLGEHPGIAVPLLCLLLAPLVIENRTWRRNAYAAALVVFFSIAAYLYYLAIRLLLSTDSLSDFEGPDGEGAPMAPLLGLSLLAIFYEIPWTVAVIGGLRLWVRR